MRVVDLASDLAPTGTLRASINLGNPVLAQGTPTAPRGVTVDIARELGALKRETEETWASERVENSLLRERINDVAAEVARLASALEGPNSPIEALLAAETSHERVSTGGTAAGEAGMADPSTNGNLADRIRALQTHASRLPQGDNPKTRN